MAAKMTPVEFADQYLYRDVYLYPQELSGKAGKPKVAYEPPTGWQTVTVDNYRLGHSPWSYPFWTQDVAPNLRKPIKVTVKDIWGVTRELDVRSAETVRRFFHYPFVGKGSPEHVQVAIQLLYRFRQVSTPLERFGTLDFIGLDCNGFVGNYIQRVVQEQDWLHAKTDEDPGPTSLMSDLHHRKGLTTPVTSLKELRGEETYVLVMCDASGRIADPSKDNPTSFGHIMITEPDTLEEQGEGLGVLVVEATASGQRKLRYVPYVIKSEKRVVAGVTVFTVDRNRGEGNMYVRISRLAV